MADEQNYNATQAQLDFVKSVGLQRNQLSGFARPVYYFLADEVVTLPKSDLNTNHHNIEETLTRQKADQDQISVYPNPLVDEQITLNWKNEEDTASGVIEIQDFAGRVIKSVSIINGQNVIDITGTPKGILLLSLKVKGKILQSLKLTNI